MAVDVCGRRHCIKKSKELLDEDFVIVDNSNVTKTEFNIVLSYIAKRKLNLLDLL